MGQDNSHDKMPPYIKARRRATGRAFAQLAAPGSLIGVFVPIGWSLRRPACKKRK
jgi:hypothetical protein